MLSNSYSYSHPTPEESEEAAPLLANQAPSAFALDLSHLAHSADEKLPAIIITPCMPSSPLDYEIAFLASGKDEYDPDVSSPWALFRQPATSLLRLGRNSSRRARTAVCLALPTVVIGVHLLINHLMTDRDPDGAEPWPSPFWN